MIVVKDGIKLVMIVTNVMILVTHVLEKEVKIVLLVKLHTNYMKVNVLKIVQKDT